ncbi:MAG TPA: ABC transporter ATP-binding protein, partial [Lachnospiraceae bacterium]|nr:ABC transporter ATP-binding protein [Lachnospiraceae bacterium]
KALMDTFILMNATLGSTILMVTHDAMVGSYANRVLFLKDGKLWNELLKGNRDRQEMYREILTVCTALGGGSHVQ